MFTEEEGQMAERVGRCSQGERERWRREWVDVHRGRGRDGGERLDVHRWKRESWRREMVHVHSGIGRREWVHWQMEN